MFQFALSLFGSVGNYVLISDGQFKDINIDGITPISMAASETHVAVVSESGELYYASKTQSK